MKSMKWLLGAALTIMVGGLPPPRMMKETSVRKVAGRGRKRLWRLDPALNVTRRTDSHPGLPP